MSERRRRLPDWLWLPASMLCAVVLALLVRTFLVEFYYVPSGSMLETIQEGDFLVAEKVSLHFSEPAAGDVVTFENPEGGDVLIKRVIATAGQTVDLVDGGVVVDGVPVHEPYTLGKPTNSLSDLPGSEGIDYPYTVPEGTVWVMGDNRTNSRDSRYFGPVPVDDVTSRALLILWPLSDIRAL